MTAIDVRRVTPVQNAAQYDGTNLQELLDLCLQHTVVTSTDGNGTVHLATGTSIPQVTNIAVGEWVVWQGSGIYLLTGTPDVDYQALYFDVGV